MEGNSQAWKKFLFDNAQDMVSAKAAIAQASDNFDIRKMAACTTGDNNIFYILCGWMTETDAEDFQKDIKNDSNVFCRYAKMRKASSVTLNVWCCNESAMGFYEKLGLKPRKIGMEMPVE